MTKRNFIQLVIRTCGVVVLITSSEAIIRGAGIGLAMLFLLPASDPPAFLTMLVLAGQLIQPTIVIILIVYLLFGGKCITNLVHRTSTLELEDSLHKENYPEILTRLIAVWWLWKMIHEILRMISWKLYALLLDQHQWLLAHLDKPDETIAKLQKMIPPARDHLYYSALANIILYALLAWYFLKGGKLFINLLNRRWLGKTEGDLKKEFEPKP